jgi:hypothetical protein
MKNMIELELCREAESGANFAAFVDGYFPNSSNRKAFVKKPDFRQRPAQAMSTGGFTRAFSCSK